MSDAQNTAGRFAELRSQPIVACCCRWLNHSSDLLTRVLFVTIINSLERSGEVGGGMMMIEDKEEEVVVVVVGEMAT